MNKILNSIKLYTAADIIEAQLVQKLLASEGITTSLKNANLQSGVGPKTGPECGLDHNLV